MGFNTNLNPGRVAEVFDQYVLNRINIALSGSFMREEKIFLFHPDEDSIQRLDLTSPEMIMKAIPELLNHQSQYMLQDKFFLREAAFAHENGWRIKEPDIQDETLHLKETDPYLLSSLKAYTDCHSKIEQNRENCLISAVETDAGVLVFDNSGYGMIACQAYLQQIADNYYLPDQKLSYLKYYDIETSDKVIIDAARECYKTLSPISPEFLIENAKLFNKDIVQDIKPAYEQDMDPVNWDFDSFKDKFSLHENKRNVNINYLSQIAEGGYTDSVRRKEAGGQIEHSNSFRGIDYRLKMNENLYDRKNNLVSERIQSEAKNIAKRILASQYLACGYNEAGNKKNAKIKSNHHL